jgi:GTP-binding protein
LLNALTRARAKIGDYAFTTVHPHVGVVEYADFTQISIADLPGILPDLTRGFGTRFLAHLQKCKIIIFVVDVSSSTNEHPYEQYVSMRNAIDFYDSAFLKQKKTIVVAHKVDELEAGDLRLDELRQRLDGEQPVVPMSAKKRINLSKFLKFLRHVYESSTP